MFLTRRSFAQTLFFVMALPVCAQVNVLTYQRVLSSVSGAVAALSSCQQTVSRSTVAHALVRAAFTLV
jgi:hypothetical protein